MLKRYTHLGAEDLAKLLGCDVMVYAFEWDTRKAQSNVRKHGVTFDEAKTCFHDPWQVAFYDPDHSEEEDRELLIGHSNQGRLLLVSYTLREDLVRIISARKAAASEENQYAQGI